MKLHLTRSAGRNLFTGYGDGYVSINETRHEVNLVVTPEQTAQWHVESFEALAPEHFETLLALKPEIVIFGAGERLRFPRPALTRSLADARVGFEAMDTKAACRTYNILVSEGRQVVAAILI